MLGIDGGRIDFGTVEIVRELVEEPRFSVGVAQLELLLGELTVKVEHRPLGRYVFCDLDGIDGLAKVGIRKEAADFAFVPERVEEFVRIRAAGSVLQGIVCLLDGQHANLLRILGGLDGAGNGLDRVGFHSGCG